MRAFRHVSYLIMFFPPQSLKEHARKREGQGAKPEDFKKPKKFKV